MPRPCKLSSYLPTPLPARAGVECDPDSGLDILAEAAGPCTRDANTRRRPLLLGLHNLCVRVCVESRQHTW